MNPRIEAILDALNATYGGDLPDHLDWREMIRQSLEDAWNDGYTTGFADQGKPFNLNAVFDEIE